MTCLSEKVDPGQQFLVARQGTIFMTNNWIELNLTKDEEKQVLEGAALHQAIHIESIETVFKIATGIKILRDRHYGMGRQGGFGDALVQYGYTARDRESPMDRGIRSNLEELATNETAVRAWWHSVPERKKRHWESARAIYRHWKASTKPPADPNAPSRRNPIRELQATNVELQKQLKAALAREHVRERFEPSAPIPDIVQALFGMFRAYSNNKGEKIAKQWLELIEGSKRKPAAKKAAAVAKPPKPKSTPEAAGSWNNQGVFVPAGANGE
jgi:hypothetical protein